MSSKRSLVALSTFALLLAACSSGAAASIPSAQDESSPSTDQSFQGSADTPRDIARLADVELPVEMQLILGTLNLEATDLAVDPDQAAELLVLWKALRSLSASDTAAEVEITAVLEQIQNTMTADQIEAIEAMELSPEDIQTVTEDHGFEFGAPEGFEGFQGGPSGGGQFGGGGGPGGGGQFGGGGGFQGDDGDHEPGTEGGFARFGRRAGGFLIEPLIELLVQRAGLEGA